jgi:hypothetical protein
MADVELNVDGLRRYANGLQTKYQDLGTATGQMKAIGPRLESTGAFKNRSSSGQFAQVNGQLAERLDQVNKSLLEVRMSIEQTIVDQDQRDTQLGQTVQNLRSDR